ncbi:TadE/TadG family type IV pilus assembly protein [Rhizobium puerariae]|uniref:TadE/TadG family type IV pilus assembly protein n=1 Tax=Rhizobium puerariae TaxID=1585791 RepID=A0ABV6A9S4_9HYPH
MKHTLFSRLIQDRAGNFGIMTAAMLPVLLGAAGVAIDLTHVMEVKNRLQSVADASTLATAAAMADKGEMTEAEAEKMGLDTFAGQAASNEDADDQDAAAKAFKDNTSIKATITSTSNTATGYEIRLKTVYDVPLNGMTAILGFKTMRVSVESIAASSRDGNALSMYLALDESGSMAWDTTTVNPDQPTKQVAYKCGYKTCYQTVTNYITKIQSLKTAATVMFDELDKADPNKELVRVGADSYDDKTKTEQAIAWGTTAVRTYIGKLPTVPDGGTDASGALTNALNALKTANATEKNAHDSKKNTSFERFIVFMTDGEMTGNSSNWNSTIDTKVRGICDAAKVDGLTDAEKAMVKAGTASEAVKSKGIKIYTIAFMAPDKGKDLLGYCSSGDDYYYEPNNMTQLVQSFGEIARKAAKTGTRLTN